MIKGVFDKFYDFSHLVYRRQGARNSDKHYFKLLKEHQIEIRRLSKQEKKQVDLLWRGLVKDYSTHELYYSVTGTFDPGICSEMLFRTKIELMLNNQQFKRAWADKCYFERIFPELSFPHTFVRNIGGHFYDEKYTLISEEDAIRIIEDHPKYVAKPSLDNGVGKGVRLIETKNTAAKDVLKKYKQDFVLQDVFEQHDVLQRFSPVSVNVMRVMTLMLKDKVHYLSASLRASTSGAFNDNCITDDGMGMIVIGVDDKGYVKDRGFFSCGESTDKLADGFKFGGVKIPGFELIPALVTNAHEKLGHFGFVSWDVTIDKSGKPVIMEYNIKGMGMLYYQYANGPLFQDKTEDIIDLLKSK